MSQHTWILNALKKGPITALDALKGCGSMKLSTRISELKRQGHPIITEMVYMGEKRFARYRLLKGKK